MFEDISNLKKPLMYDKTNLVDEEADVEVETDFLDSISGLASSNRADAFRLGGGIGEVTRSEVSEIDDF